MSPCWASAGTIPFLPFRFLLWGRFSQASSSPSFLLPALSGAGVLSGLLDSVGGILVESINGNPKHLSKTRKNRTRRFSVSSFPHSYGARAFQIQPKCELGLCQSGGLPKLFDSKASSQILTP